MNNNPTNGYSTKKIINLYIKNLKKKEKKINHKNIKTLYATSNKKDKLYFWQLYSLLGEDVITNIIQKFYIKILSDTDNKWFSDVFRETGSLVYHVINQKRFWMECMGGGHYYKHGKKTLYSKHQNVSEIMIEKGADLWLDFMYKTLDEYEELKIDERVIPCIKDFLEFFMKKYSKQFSFKYKSKL